MTGTSIDPELAGCADEELAVIDLHLAELRSGATPNTRIPMTQLPYPRHCRYKSFDHCTPSARRSDDAELDDRPPSPELVQRRLGEAAAKILENFPPQTGS